MPLPRRPEYRLAFGLPRLAVEKLRAFQPDIVHIALAPDLLGYSAWRIARSGKIPVVASYHTRYETYFKHYWYAPGIGRLVGYYLRRFYGACREVYVPTQSMVDALLADGLTDNFRLWPRGVDTAHFNPGQAVKKLARETWIGREPARSGPRCPACARKAARHAGRHATAA